MEDWFEGRLGARTQLTLYNPADRVGVIAHGITTYHSASVTGSWQTRFFVYNDQGEIVGSAYGFHTIAPWSNIDYADETFLMDCGKFSQSQNVRVELAARVPAYTGLWQAIAEVWIPVYVRASEVEPSPIPDNPENVYPAPEPEPTPIITPTPTPSPSPTPAPSFTLPDWVLPVAVAGVALMVLVPKKKGK